MRVVVVTGGFDPLHSGHIAYFEAAKRLGDLLVVGLNSDAWLTRKKGRPFLPWTERRVIIQSLKMVDVVIPFDDRDAHAKDAIRCVRDLYPDADIIFANGGDRQPTNTAEQDYPDSRVFFVFGVGGSDKKNSSSWILQRWKDGQVKT